MKTFKSYKVSGIILILCLLCIPSISAVVIPGISENKVTFERQTPLNSGKPDLAIDSIGFTTIGDAQNVWVVCAIVDNRGNETADGEMNLAYVIKRLPSTITIRSDTILSYQSLRPGGESFFTIANKDILPKFGFFRVTCEVNPGRLINESNYDNNKGAQNFLVLFSYWFAIG